MQRMIKKWEEPSFLKTLLLAFTNFMIINIERFAGINFVIAVTKTFFYIQFYPADCEYFGTFFLKFMCP